MRYCVVGITDIGRNRSLNQDNFYCEGIFRELETDNTAFEITVDKKCPWLTAVFDGMGGESDGETASLIAAELTAHYCKEPEEKFDPDELINLINRRICDEAKVRKCSMGSTCVYLEFDDDSFRCRNIGDSRAYLLHEGALVQLSEDHTEAASFSAIFKDETTVKRGGENTLTQYLGIPEDDFIIEPYVSARKKPDPKDILLLCSDGLTHSIEDADICKVLRSDNSLKAKRDELLKLALEKGGPDNITIILIEANPDS